MDFSIKHEYQNATLKKHHIKATWILLSNILRRRSSQNREHGTCSFMTEIRIIYTCVICLHMHKRGEVCIMILQLPCCPFWHSLDPYCRCHWPDRLKTNILPISIKSFGLQENYSKKFTLNFASLNTFCTLYIIWWRR